MPFEDVPYCILSATTFDDEYSLKEFSAKGWQSAKNSSYPQDLIIKIESPNPYQIISCLEISIAKSDLNFELLGFITFDENTESEFQTQELKTIQIGHYALYIKLDILDIHRNKLNIFNQFKASILSFKIVTESQTQRMNENSFDYVLKEDYLRAKRSKEIIELIETVANEIVSLSLEKSKAVSEENFDLAHDLKLRIEKVKLSLEKDINSLESGSFEENQHQNHIDQRNVQELSKKTVITQDEERPLPALQNKNIAIETTEELSESIKKEFEIVISLFGLDLLSDLLSRNFQKQISAFQSILEQINDSWESDPKSTCLACIQCMAIALGDSREKIVSYAYLIWFKISAKNLHGMSYMFKEIESIIPQLLVKGSDSNVRIKKVVLDIILDIAGIFYCLPESIYPHLIRPFNKSTPSRILKGRLDIVYQVLLETEIPPHSGWSLENLMSFIKDPLTFSATEIREVSQNIARKLYLLFGNKIESYLSHLKDNQIKLITAIVETPGCEKSEKHIPSKRKEKILASIKPTNNYKEKILKEDLPPDQTSGTVHIPEASNMTLSSKRNVCVFCKEQFFETSNDVMSRHFNECPLLCKCPYCSSLKEVSQLNEHVLHECAIKPKVIQCMKCYLAIPEVSEDFIRCPLCLEYILKDPLQEGLRCHLMNGIGCKNKI
ncbi:hypothetical protein ROZALSC1DRAFT_27915, partial [Rozella allomycis CSF55]